jgi:predicted transposase/invertase (TIGR01784 family)
MDAQNKQCADSVLEKLGLGLFYHGNKPLVWIAQPYSAPTSLREDVAPYNAEEKDFSLYFVKEGEFGPYASLLYDKTFKKAFSPDTRRGKRNLLNLLNDMLEGQIPQKIKDVASQQQELNDSGSKVSKSSILDLHCRDEHDNFIEIEVQIQRETNFLKRLVFYSSQMIVQQGEPGHVWDYNVKPVYVISFAGFRVFDDSRPLHRAGILDYDTAEQLVDSANFTIIELPKVKRMIRPSDSEVAKWLFIFRYLDRLKELPPALKTEKFEGLLPFAKLARFNKKELKRYRYIMHLKWDRYAQELAFAEDHPDFVKKIGDEAVEKALNIVERMQKKGASMATIRASLGFSNNSK